MAFTLSTQAAATSPPTQHIQFRHFKGQDIPSNQPAIRNANTSSAMVCALLCSQDDNCLSISFHGRKGSCYLSSAYPVLVATDVPTDVFFKGMLWIKEKAN